MKPSLTALVFLLWIAIVPTLAGRRLLNADGDLPRHIRHGQTMLARHDLIRADPFSYSRPGEPFLGFEYLSQVALGGAERIGGLAGVAFLAALIIAASYTLVLRFLLARGVDPLLAYITTLLSAAVGSVHWAARPHLVTVLGVALLLPLLERRAAPRMWLVVPLFAIWANFHAGFIYGFVLLGIYLGGELLEAILTRDGAGFRSAAPYAAMLGLGAVASLLTPFGTALYRHLGVFFADPYLREYTEEFQSPNFHGGIGRALLATLLVIIVALALVRQRPSWPRLLAILANIAFALSAQRNIALLALVAFPLLALHANTAWRTLPDVGGVRAVFERDAHAGRTGAWIIAATIAMACIALNNGRIAGVQVIPDRFDRLTFPVEAVAAAKAAHLPGPIFHEFTWGGYLLYAWPGQPVFIDGGSDFYGGALLRTFVRTISVEPGWRETLSRWQIRSALLDTDSPLALELAREPGWHIWRRDSVATVLLRDSLVAP